MNCWIQAQFISTAI